MDEKLLGRSLRCPRLGSFVTLSYCLREGRNLPCRYILGCFSDIRDRLLPILMDMYSVEDLKKAFSPPEDPYTRLLKRISSSKSGEE